MAGLELAKYRLVLQPLEPITLPEYKGATFRGGFGSVFRRVACACGAGGSIHQPRCLYAQVFETPRREDLPALPRTAHLPHPFVLEPPIEAQRLYTPDDRLIIHLILIGQALEWLPYFVFAFDELGRGGIGQKRGRYQIDEVCSVSGADTAVVFSGKTRRFLGPGFRMTFDALWQPDEAVQAAEIEFLTYARVLGRGHLRSSLDFPLLFGALLRRMALLVYAHGGGGSFSLPSSLSIEAVAVLRYFYDRSSQNPEARQAIRDAFHMAEQVTTMSSRLHWEDWERYSTRQETSMTLGGLLGTVCYSGPVASFLPYLRLGEYIHVGKNTTFGLGQMVLRV